MNKEQLLALTNEELLIEKKKLQKSRILHATIIGFLAGIVLFGTIAWSMSPDKQVGFLIPILFPIVAIYRMLKNAKKDQPLVEVLKERNLYG